MMGAVGLALALLGLALWFWREHNRSIRLAEQRVSFVNQVSHELKTPLTNIRMYAELLEDALWDLDDKSKRYLGVLTEESQRLSRMITNILSFASDGRSQLAVRPIDAVPDDVIRTALSELQPSLREAGIQEHFTGRATSVVKVDADALTQILFNLLSNVEKYAAQGGLVHVESQQVDGILTITVSDAGPGIPARESDAIFEPFRRLSDAHEDGVSGTGIGLSIARTLARLHGGDLRLGDSEKGSRFIISLRTEVT